MAEEKYTRCPDCGRKSVYSQQRPNGEDNHQCRYRDCDFFFFTSSGAAVDAKNEARWEAANSTVTDGVTPSVGNTFPRKDADGG